MSANFETIFRNQGFSHIAKQIISYLHHPQDLLACCEVSKECHDLIYKQEREKLLSYLEDLRQPRENFSKYFPDHLQVIAYFANLENYPKTYHFIQFMYDWLEKQNYVYEFMKANLRGGVTRSVSADSDDDGEDEMHPKTLLNDLRKSCIPRTHPIKYAIEEDNYQMLKILMESPANFDPVYDWDYVTPMMHACAANSSPEIIDLLVENVFVKSIL